MDDFERKITINDEKNNQEEDLPFVNSIYDFPIKKHNPLVSNKGKYAKNIRRNMEFSKKDNTNSNDNCLQPSKYSLDERLITASITPKKIMCVQVISFVEDFQKNQDIEEKKEKEEKKINIKYLFKSKTNLIFRKSSEYRNISYKFQSQYFQYALTIKSIYSQYIAIARSLNTLHNIGTNSSLMNVDKTIKDKFKRDISKYES